MASKDPVKPSSSRSRTPLLKQAALDVLDLVPLIPELWTPEIRERCESLVREWDRAEVARTVAQLGRALQLRDRALAAVGLLRLHEYDDALTLVLANARHRSDLQRGSAYDALSTSLRPEAAAILEAAALLDSDDTNRGNCVEMLADSQFVSSLERIVPVLLRLDRSDYVLFQAAYALWYTDAKVDVAVLEFAAARQDVIEPFMGNPTIVGALYLHTGELRFLIELVERLNVEETNAADTTLGRLEPFYDLGAIGAAAELGELKDVLRRAATTKWGLSDKPTLAALAER